MSSDDDFYLFTNGSVPGPWDGPQYHIAPPWAFYLQTAFMGSVFAVGTPLNAVVLWVTVRYKRLRQPLNYILVNNLGQRFVSCVLSVFVVFVASARGYFVFGKRVCELEAFVGTTGGTRGCRGCGVCGIGGTMGCSIGAAPHRYMPEGLQCSCGPDWYTVGTKYRSEYYTWFLFIFCFIVPLSLIIFSYSQLLSALRACIMETVCGKPLTDDSDASSSAQRTEVSSVSSSQVSPT
ncbi:LOW QUALITY PROTEIN: violet-sensitive opsin-like [Coturnix japonica]|uniref:LOW QUALITY PROTEIN: violet-sensitive opsin-like n=1 Tax=Coturnix japonica TaxID=93934 RepID=UPI0013A5C1A0|nr:LOW QUALITY PROTEIN: violet-sensitive opsin-like [Coturnix japonica]